MAETPAKPVTLTLRLEAPETSALCLLLGLLGNPQFVAAPLKSEELEAHNPLKAKYRAVVTPGDRPGLVSVKSSKVELTEEQVRYLQARYKDARWPASDSEGAEALGKALDTLAPRFADIEKAKARARA